MLTLNNKFDINGITFENNRSETLGFVNNLKSKESAKFDFLDDLKAEPTNKIINKRDAIAVIVRINVNFYDDAEYEEPLYEYCGATICGVYDDINRAKDILDKLESNATDKELYIMEIKEINK